jgi:hypothetical protein
MIEGEVNFSWKWIRVQDISRCCLFVAVIILPNTYYLPASLLSKQFVN